MDNKDHTIYEELGEGTDEAVQRETESRGRKAATAKVGAARRAATKILSVSAVVPGSATRGAAHTEAIEESLIGLDDLERDDSVQDEIAAVGVKKMISGENEEGWNAAEKDAVRSVVDSAAVNIAPVDFAAAERGANNSARANIVTARGTGDGLVVRLDGRVSAEDLMAAVKEFVKARRSFIANNSVALEWVGVLPAAAIVEEVSEILKSAAGVTVRESRLRATAEVLDMAAARDGGNSFGERGSAERSRSSLFGGLEAGGIPAEEARRGLGLVNERRRMTKASPAPTRGTEVGGAWDDPDARIVYATLRSGQKIESEHSVIVCGDINSGAEVVAGGDIVVLGSLRGVAHAGAYDEAGGGRFIFALNLQPTQLRIGSLISRGSNETRSVPEIARVDGTLIVVESYSSRSAMPKR